MQFIILVETDRMCDHNVRTVIILHSRNLIPAYTFGMCRTVFIVYGMDSVHGINNCLYYRLHVGIQ